MPRLFPARSGQRLQVAALMLAITGCQNQAGPTGPVDSAGNPVGGTAPAPEDPERLTRPSVAQIASVYWSGDGKWLVTTSSDQTITIWDPTQGWSREAEREPARLGRQTFSGPFNWAAVAGDRLVDDIGQKLTVREISTGRTVRVLDQSEHIDGERFFLTPDGRRLVAFSVPQQELRYWDMGTGKLAGRATPKTEFWAGDLIGISADGAEAYVVLTGKLLSPDTFRNIDNEGIHAVDLKTGRVDLRVKHPLHNPGAVRLVSATDGRAFVGDEIWNLRTGKKLGTGPWKSPAAVDPAGRLLADLEYPVKYGPDDDLRIPIWDVRAKKKLGYLPRLALLVDNHTPTSTFSADGKSLAIGGCRDWDSDRLPEERRRPKPMGIVGVFAPYKPTYRHVEDRALVVYDVATQKRVRMLAFPIWPLDSDEVPDPEVP